MPSEHTFGGEKRDFEVQFYHTEKVVLSLTFSESDDATSSSFLKSFILGDNFNEDRVSVLQFKIKESRAHLGRFTY